MVHIFLQFSDDISNVYCDVKNVKISFKYDTFVEFEYESKKLWFTNNIQDFIIMNKSQYNGDIEDMYDIFSFSFSNNVFRKYDCCNKMISELNFENIMEIVLNEHNLSILLKSYKIVSENEMNIIDETIYEAFDKEWDYIDSICEKIYELD